MTHVGFAYSNVRYNMCNPYDVDPLLGSVSTPGYAEYAALYRRNRVNHATIRVGFTNLETVPGLVYICPVNADPGANTANYQEYLSNSLTKKRVIGAVAGNSTSTISSRASTSQFGGSANLMVDDSYSTLVNTSAGPANAFYFLVGYFQQTGAIANGINLYIDCMMNVDFYERSTPAV
jgi:hypothetical protein